MNPNQNLKNKSFFYLTLFLLAFISLVIVSAQSSYGPPIKSEDYEISRSKIDREITQGDIFEDIISIKNFKSTEIVVSLGAGEDLTEIVSFETAGSIIPPNNESNILVSIIGKEVRTYRGDITLSGDIKEKIELNIKVINESLNPEFFITVVPLKKKFTFKDDLDFKIDIEKILQEDIKNISFFYSIQNTADNKSHFLGAEVINLPGSIELRKKINFPEELLEGYYILNLTTKYQDKTYISTAGFLLKTPFWSIKILGFLPIWLLAILIFLAIIGITIFIIIRKIIERRKKYKMQIYKEALPKKNERSFWLGKVAETNMQAYYDAEALTTHGVVAGATGGGKSISAQVIIEEALLKNIAVIVFDPTAQWSGLLRKCEDKKMISFYPRFGLKSNAARAFPGNIRMIQNERQLIDINKYMNPGQIQIFAMNKLTPPQIDTFVATVIASIFKSDPKEFPSLRVLLVFDEVHRLLPKFGGSGKGFLQIERACREFRKWGFGVMLVSQVLSDFVGEIKANINTEVQMRTRDESDLNRLKTKYGEEFLQSLIKASVGVGMFVNPKYNKGKPYFINFRPILHNTRRLSDEILEKYNKYSEIIEDYEYQIEQLEKEKVDTFDLKMELKLVKDKLMTGNFTVVDIYIEGLKPRMEQQWKSIGKTPKKRELELVDISEVEASLAKAQKGRDKWADKEKTQEVTKEEKKEDPSTKIVASLTFDNGNMVSSLNELKEILPNLDPSVFKIHVNDEKNEIADWVAKNIDSKLGAKLKQIKDKNEMLKAIQGFGKEEPKNEKKKEEKAGSKPGGEKEQSKPAEKKQEKSPGQKTEKQKEVKDVGQKQTN